MGWNWFGLGCFFDAAPTHTRMYDNVTRCRNLLALVDRSFCTDEPLLFSYFHDSLILGFLLMFVGPCLS